MNILMANIYNIMGSRTSVTTWHCFFTTSFSRPGHFMNMNIFSPMLMKSACRINWEVWQAAACSLLLLTFWWDCKHLYT